MDIREYIASGILHDYAMGTVSDQERREVQCLSKIYPEIHEALLQAEDDMHKFATAYARKAPAGLRDRILQEVRNTEPLPAVIHHTSAPVAGVDTAPHQAKVVEMKPETSPEAKRGSNVLWAVAAAVFLVFGLWQYFESISIHHQMEEAQRENALLATDLEQANNELASTHQGLDEAFDPNARKVVLKSTREGEELQLALFWNTQNGQVKLDPSALPELSDDLQYQLWVLLDGQPIDMGVLPKDAVDVLIANGSTLAGQAFAITIEPLGGLPSPTLEQLVLLGEVA